MDEHRTAQDGLAGQPAATAEGRTGHAGADQREQFGMFIEPFGSAFQLRAARMDNFVRLEYAGLSGAVDAHRDLRCFGCCCGL